MNENMNKFSTLKPKMFKGKNLKFSQMKRQHWMEADDFLSLHLKHCENIDNEPQTQERRFSFAPWSLLHSIVCGSIKWLGSLIDQKETDPREKSPRQTLIQGRGCTRWGGVSRQWNFIPPDPCDNCSRFRLARPSVARKSSSQRWKMKHQPITWCPMSHWPVHPTSTVEWGDFFPPKVWPPPQRWLMASIHSIARRSADVINSCYVTDLLNESAGKRRAFHFN